MTAADRDGRRRRETWIPRATLVVLPAAWVALAATLPASADRDVTIDVFCTSGNPVVGVWIESRSGGSWFARRGDAGSATSVRYTFKQKFTDAYQARVGCGGNQQQWGLTVVSSYSDRPYRRLACDDADDARAAANGCRDQTA
ncbi:hypothetical protein AB0E12_23750 [Micromonospora chersina]|uniref:hypothetical protein n=1 Tax=Micromonospora chersina TaxID=47854 RepID=UPI0033FEED6D